MLLIYSIISSFWNLLYLFVICDCVIVTCDICVTICDCHMWCHASPNSKPKNKKLKLKWNENNLSLLLSILTNTLFTFSSSIFLVLCIDHSLPASSLLLLQLYCILSLLLFLQLYCLLDMVHTRGESLQDWLRDVQTCWTTLASAYVLYCLSAV